MKSMVHEASSVAKAIQKAWEAAGMPKEFTIKVLQLEERGILWFSKEPAVVSICYHEPRQHGTSERRDDKRQWRSSNPNNHGTRRDKPSFNNEDRNQAPKRYQRPPSKKTTERPVEAEPTRQTQTQENPIDEVTKWTDPYKNDIIAWAEEIGTSIVGGQIGVTTSGDGATLRIMFGRSLVQDNQQQSIACQSLQTLLLQFLKKKHKKRFRGLHLIVEAARP